MKTIEDSDVIATFKARLQAELDEIHLLIDASQEARNPVELDQQSVGRLSRMDAMQQQAMAQDLNRRRRQRKVALELALTRISQGEFGYCAECGEAIALRRLDIEPISVFCVRCAS